MLRAPSAEVDVLGRCPPHLSRQGTALGREGRVRISADDRGLWVGGRTEVALSGTIELGY